MIFERYFVVNRRDANISTNVIIGALSADTLLADKFPIILLHVETMFGNEGEGFCMHVFLVQKMNNMVTRGQIEALTVFFTPHHKRHNSFDNYISITY